MNFKNWTAALTTFAAIPAALFGDDGAASTASLDLMKVFMSCPLIYTVLLFLSVAALTIWIYTLATLRESTLIPDQLLQKVRNLFEQKSYDQALKLCKESPSFTSSIIAAGLSSKQHGPQVMIESMRAEGRREGNAIWQRISLLNEISVVAPMLGLLGTVIGLFFAFYDSNSSAESIASVFDGLGIAIGTTVAGLIVAILAMIFYTTLKYRVVGLLNTVENETLALVSLVNADPSLKH